MRLKRPMAILTLTAVALAGAGCGSSGLSDAAFTSKLAAICAPSTSAIDNLTPGDPAEFKNAVAIVSGTLSKFEALSPPADRAAAYHSFLSFFKQEDGLLIQEEHAVSTGNTAAAIAIDTRSQSLVAHADAATKASHLRCS